MELSFATGRQYATALLKPFGAKRVKELNTESLEDRLTFIRDYSERFCRSSYGDNALPFGYNPASYGLWWATTSGRVNSTVYHTLKAMTMRQLCELVHTLLVECGDTTSDYARYLIAKYSQAA
jgi:dolichyl-phosphate-mannose--protein O-mannosyl transferase